MLLHHNVLLRIASTSWCTICARAGGERHCGSWPRLHGKILKLKREAISPAWVQMRTQNKTRDFQSMIHELEELWSCVFERGRKTVNPNPLVDSKQVFSWLQPGSIGAGKIFWF